MNNNKPTKGKRHGVELSPSVVSQRQLNKKLKVEKKSTTPTKRRNMREEDEGQYPDYSNDSDGNYSPDHISSRKESSLIDIKIFLEDIEEASEGYVRSGTSSATSKEIENKS